MMITHEAPSFQLLSSLQWHQETGESFMFSKKTELQKKHLEGIYKIILGERMNVCYRLTIFYTTVFY